MLNIISRSILSKKIRGPKKVAQNLIDGLDKIGYPYVINKSLDATNRLWVHDDISALKYIEKLPENVKVLIGPNLFINPEDIPPKLKLKRTVYIQPSEQVKRIWEKRGYIASRLTVWPTGVNTEKFQLNHLSKKQVLVYFKNRKEEELRQVLFALSQADLSYQLISYGQYKEEDYIQALSESSFVIWLGVPESQGLALEEALAANVPVLVIDQNKIEYEVRLTSAPYFNQQCGLKITDLKEIPTAIEKMITNQNNFQPRQFILENLSLEKQARDFINLYDIYFDLSYESGLREKLQNNNNWRNSSWWFKTYMALRDIL